jgi:hypothetical protein
VIADCLPEKSLKKAVEDLEKGAKLADKLFEWILDRAEKLGKVIRVIKSSDKDKEEGSDS